MPAKMSGEKDRQPAFGGWQGSEEAAQDEARTILPGSRCRLRDRARRALDRRALPADAGHQAEPCPRLRRAPAGRVPPRMEPGLRSGSERHLGARIADRRDVAVVRAAPPITLRRFSRRRIAL